jgi:hypothetical protein
MARFSVTVACAQGNMLEAIIAERGRVRAGGKKLRSLLVSVMCYVTLNDEPRLAWRALQLMQLICQTRDQDVLQVLVSDTSEASRDHIIMAFADWLKQSDSEHHVSTSIEHHVSTSIFDFILDSLARVEDEHSTAHFLLGFSPYQPALSELSRNCPTTKLLQAVCGMCGDEDRWMAKEEDLLAIREAMEEDEGNVFADRMEESGLDERKMALLHMARNEHALEILYRLVAHLGTREATLRLLLDPHAYQQEERAAGVGLLLTMMESLPIDKALQQGLHVQTLRRKIKDAWAGGGLDMLDPPWDGEDDLQVFQRYWMQGKRDLSLQDALDDWQLALERELDPVHDPTPELHQRTIDRCQVTHELLLPCSPDSIR